MLKAMYNLMPDEMKKQVKKECIEKIKNFLYDRDRKKKEDKTLEKYLQIKYLEFSYLMPLALNQKEVLLKKIYYPLTLKSSEIEIKIEKFTFLLFENNNRIIIEDDAGMGKSTLMKFLFLSRFDILDKSYIPIFFELRNYDVNYSFKDNIIKSFEKIECEIDKNLFNKEFIIFLDGFDEVKEQDKILVANSIKDFTNSNNKNLYLISSRKDKYLDILSNYSKFKLKSLSEKEGVELLKKYVEKEKNNKFFKRVNEELDNLKSFLTTPLLASMIYMAYKPKENLPRRKIDLYDQVFEALYVSHDRNSKAGYFRQLEYTSQKLLKILSEFSFKNLISLEVSFFKEEIIKKLESVKKEGLNFDVNILLEILEIKVPLLTNNGNIYFWKHKSFQEYFIALYISNHARKEEIIEKMIISKDNMKYYNIFSFLYEMEKNFVLLKMIENIKKEYEILEKELPISTPNIITNFLNYNKIYTKKKLKNHKEKIMIKFEEFENSRFLCIEELRKHFINIPEDLEMEFTLRRLDDNMRGQRIILTGSTYITTILKFLRKIMLDINIDDCVEIEDNLENYIDEDWQEITKETLNNNYKQIELELNNINSDAIDIKKIILIYNQELKIYTENKISYNENSIIDNI